ncbi:hypothetical protein NL676_029763 [Syzygium grande]|nr:hypothetical protein NL676_029763 [Syzygium grande]
MRCKKQQRTINGGPSIGMANRLSPRVSSGVFIVSARKRWQQPHGTEHQGHRDRGVRGEKHGPRLVLVKEIAAPCCDLRSWIAVVRRIRCHEVGLGWLLMKLAEVGSGNDLGAADSSTGKQPRSQPREVKP